MDYKEKYEQALERAKKLQANAKGLILNKWLYGVFPELEETEDERIRKYLIDGIKHLSEKSSFFTAEVSKGKVIAWLEKQKEQKPVNTIVEDLPKGEDYGIDSLWHAIQILERTLGEVEGYQSDDGILEHKCAIEAIKRLYKQKPAEIHITLNEAAKEYSGKESHPLNNAFIAGAKWQEEQNFTWSKEDERNLEGIINEIEANKNNAPDCDLATYDRFLSWLKSIKQRMEGE